MKYEEILRDLDNKSYHPIYLLMGEEPFFIDKITDHIMNNVLNEGEREFNQSVLYGRDTDVQSIVESAKRFPMMASHQVVVIKEAQQIRKIEDLLPYAENPSSSTILVLNYKFKKLDKRKPLAKAIAKNGVIFTSDKVRDYQINDWISNYVSQIGYSINPRSSQLLGEFLGTDLSRIVNELEKLKLVVPKGSEITDTIIQDNIGISKEYNIFELQNAIGNKDVLKANKIIKYFAQNPKRTPLVVMVSSLYGYFSKVMKFHFIKDKSKANVAAQLKINPFFVKDYSATAQKYSPTKLAAIIGILRDYDLKSKGVSNTSIEDSQLMKEMVYKILH